MAKIDNSGYILVDFSKVDHNKKTQVISGFYDECFKLISNEKFVLLSNVNEVSTTPIPSIVLFKNGIYNVITFEYVYTIVSGDVVTVTKNEGGITVDVIDDDIIALNKTWSSSKINEMLPNNAGQIIYDNATSHLQSNRVQGALDEIVGILNTLTALMISYNNGTSGLSANTVQAAIDEVVGRLLVLANEVSDLHYASNILYTTDVSVEDELDRLNQNKQDTLTAGNNISIVNDVISAVDTTYSAGNNVSISSENVISATDTTYGAGAGLSLTGNVFSVDPSTAGIEAADVEYSSGVSVADKIDGLIDDTATSQDTTWSSDKISGEIDAVTDDLILISAEIQGSTVNIAANSWGDSTITIPNVQGYRPIAFYKIYPNSPSNLCINSFDIESSGTSWLGKVRMRSFNSVAMDAYARVSVLYIKNH